MTSNNSADLKTSTNPEDCGLAIALPLTEEEVRQDYQENAASHDYIPRHVSDGDWHGYWQKWIEPMAEVCTELGSVAAELGIDVRKSATLADLRELFHSRSVVTIVAHWRGSSLSPSDLLVPPQSLASKILDNSDEIASALRSRLNLSDLRHIRSNSDSEQSAEQLVKLLNQAIQVPSPLMTFDTYGKVTVVFDDVGLAAINRDVIERWARGEIKPGNRLELRDGLHSPAQVAQTIPSQFTGIIDFTMCHSSVLGNLLRKGQPNLRVILNNREIQPIPRLLMLKLLYKQLANGNFNYGRHLYTIYAQLLES